MGRRFKISPLSSRQPRVHNKSYFYKVWAHGLSKADSNTEAQWKLDRRVRRRQERTKSAQRVCDVWKELSFDKVFSSFTFKPTDWMELWRIEVVLKFLLLQLLRFSEVHNIVSTHYIRENKKMFKNLISCLDNKERNLSGWWLRWQPYCRQPSDFVEEMSQTLGKLSLARADSSAAWQWPLWESHQPHQPSETRCWWT